MSVATLLKRRTSALLGSLPLGLVERVIDSQTTTYQFKAEGVALCQFQVRAHKFADGSPIVMGNIPRVYGDLTVSEDDWPSLDETFRQASLETEGDTGGNVIAGPMDPKRCYWVEDGHLVPAWRFYLEYQAHGQEVGYPDAIIADQTKIFERQQAYFDATGKAKIYPSNSVKTPSLAEIVLENLTGDGTLTSDLFVTVASFTAKRVKVPSLNFDFDPGSAEFGEVSSFANVSRHYKFLAGIGFEWYDLKPLRISTNTPGLVNNARFVPQLSSTIPGQIDIGAGDGTILRNLDTDSDVIAHELGHFVIYKSITKTSGESLVLHEGLADYFAFARANDACLGESICPASSQACIKVGACLRTGDNTYRYDDDMWKQWGLGKGSLNHLHSQVISGMLWSLREKQIPASVLDPMVIKAINLLPENADLSNFLLALANADKASNGGSYFSKLQAAANDRNLGSRFPEISETGTLSKSSAVEGSVTKEQTSGAQQADPAKAEAQAPTTAVRGSDGGGCGVVHSARSSDRFVWFSMILLLFPVLSLGFRRSKYQRSI